MIDRLKRFGPLALVVAGVAVVFGLGWQRYLSLDALADSHQALSAMVAQRPVLVAAAFFAAFVLATTFALPGAIWIAIAGGFLFGAFAGTALSVAGATTGAMALYWATRSALGGALRAKAGGFVHKLERGFQRNAFQYTVVMRLLPMMPFFGVNLAAGVLRVPAAPFGLGTALGLIPVCGVYAFLGNGLHATFAAGERPDATMLSQPQIVGPLLALAALAIVPFAIGSLRRRRG